MFYWFTELADALVFGLLGMDATTRAASALHFFIEDVAKIFFLLIVIVFLLGFFRSLVSAERARRMIGGQSPWRSYPLAVALGAVTPFCSCSSVPLFIGFLEAGIPLGVTMAFLITSPMINEVAVLMLASTMGWKMAAAYVVTGLVVGLAGGLVIAALKLEHHVEAYVWQIRMGQAALPEVDATWRGRLRYAAGQVREIVGRIWPYVLGGIGVGALLHGFVPEHFFLQYAGADNPWAVPVAVLAGIPLYSNATGVIPVAEALLAKGVPIGTALALMMSVAAISLPEMIILRKVIKLPLIAIFVAWLFVAFVVVGYLFNAWFA
ncbi:permease [Magnetococcus marinus MC-1]|uniref:Permease n=1 Tax=Magnetococcus marinus (strain ATCC BAA-1437 / JCM 17883 / MC-1) TaxID=156889 RepID=A0L3U6_MAGMM|nr:permease [Magnetococcus marinus]ABK42639.1 permease [Magnetococcus marinus MC-1]